MSSQPRSERLLADQAVLQSLAAGSDILRLESFGEPADRYVLTFRGKGVARDVAQPGEVSLVDFHQIELRLPYSYPTSPPDIRWLTPILHPNVSFSGFVNLTEMGLPWLPDLGVDVICERLWDMARGAYTNLERSTNYSAKNWYEDECKFALPVDPRPLRVGTARGGSNIVKYTHRAGEGIRWTTPVASGEVLFIDETTPIPAAVNAPPTPAAQRRPRGGDEGVFYIGPE
jgi:hypothetical protein